VLRRGGHYWDCNSFFISDYQSDGSLTLSSQEEGERFQVREESEKGSNSIQIQRKGGNARRGYELVK